MNVLTIFKQIRTFIFDVDGVLTDGSVQVFDTGEQVRRMNTKDGYALQLAIKKGYGMAIISGGASEGVRKRLQGLGVRDIFLKVDNKKQQLEQYVLEKGLQYDGILYMGDDIPDYQVMKQVGLACAPADAIPDIKHISGYISNFAGGHGCVRDVIEKVLRLNGDWEGDVLVASK
ncbi:MAG: 3-deoxy-D-manno-octulosonate 8-phosphate phosphatase [Puia sp.]|nr:3-deoxy-D-manno-octulosonate 8-phosphate phosphatase [Puia sp.]